MTYYLTSEIRDAKTIHCRLTTNGNSIIENPVLCFSLQAPALVHSGGKKVEGLGGFTAVELTGTLSNEGTIDFVLGFEDPYFWVSNRTWHPQGPYLRTEGGTVVVSIDTYIGVKIAPPPSPDMPQSDLALVPVPTRWEPALGYLENYGFAISGDFCDLADLLDGLSDRRGLPKFSGKTPLTIRHDATLLADTYRLNIGEPVTLEAGDRGGAFYGLISLVTLYQTHGTIPFGTIIDGPRFEWRGFMLDCVREYYPVDAICKLLDLMAFMKLNRFHWHFADDESFRLEVKTAPDLWQKSGLRGEGEIIPSVFGGRAGPIGGTYSYADVAQIVAHAKALNIEVMPEIEVPAHALALTAIRPELRDLDDTGTEVSVQGYARNAVNPAIQATCDLLEPLSLEVAQLFPFGYLHLGGDELPEGTWDGSPLVDDYKARNGLQTYQDVQGHLMHRLAGKLRENGITPCAWQEAADGCTGGIGHDAILFSWTGAGPGREAARNGYRVVMCPAQHTYFDMAHTGDPDDWGANWAATYALDGAFNWDPIPVDAAEFADKIIGVEGTFWSEFTSDAKDYEPMIAPRILGLATKGWSADGATTLDELRKIATCYMPFLGKIGWAAHGAAIMLDTPADAVRRVDG